MRQSWTDDRLDDLSHRMDERFDRTEGEMKAGFSRVDGRIETLRDDTKVGFDRVDDEIKALSAEMKAGNTELRKEMAAATGELRKEMSAATGELRAEIADATRGMRAEIKVGHDELQAFQHTLIQIGGAILAATLGVLATFVALLLTNL